MVHVVTQVWTGGADGGGWAGEGAGTFYDTALVKRLLVDMSNMLQSQIRMANPAQPHKPTETSGHVHHPSTHGVPDLVKVYQESLTLNCLANKYWTNDQELMRPSDMCELLDKVLCVSALCVCVCVCVCVLVCVFV